MCFMVDLKGLNLDFGSEFSQIHAEKIQPELFSAGYSITFLGWKCEINLLDLKRFYWVCRV